MAGALDVALSGPRIYDGARSDQPFIHSQGVRAIGAEHVRGAVRVLWRAWGGLLAVVLALAVWSGG